MLNHHLTGLLSHKSLSSGLMSKLSCLSGCWGNPLYWSKDSVLLAVAFACGKIVEKNPLHFFRHIPEISWYVGTSLHRQMFLIRYRVIAYFSSSVLTLYVPASFSCWNECCPVQYEQQRNAGNWKVAHTHGWNIVTERLAERVWSPGVLNKVLYVKATPQRLTPYPI